MALDNKTVFLAGAAGMTGSSILSYLLHHHPTTRIVASVLKTEPCVRSERIRTVQGDLRSVEACRAMVRGSDLAIMAAAYGGGASFTTSSPFDHTRENLLMNRAMLEAFALEGVKRIVFIGSATIYQAFEGSIKEEELDFNKDPHAAYFGFGWAMRFLEKMGQSLHQQYGIDVILVRAANVFGPRDKFDPQRSNVIPALIRKAVDRMDPFVVWGSPDVVRDVIYCDDAAAAVVGLADADSIRFDAFNLGSGVRTRVGDVVTWALEAAGHRPSHGIQYVGNKPTTIGFRALDCTKIQAAIGWRPAHTIEQGVRQTTQWWLQNKDAWTR
jgi:nucleoside-diphosphate-sugar epimerase